jgi:FixJ family two-component response regulator
MPNLRDVRAQANAIGPLAYSLDDEPPVRTIVGKILVSLGFLPHQFAASAAPFTERKKAASELIVFDLVLGQSDAIEVIRNLETFRYKGKMLRISGRDYVTLREIQNIGI